MELRDLLARRRVVRSFDGTPVDAAWLESLCVDALRAPTAGNAAGVRLHVVAPDGVADLLAAASDGEWRERSRRYPGLARAGGAVVVTARVEDYLERYREPDKAESGLGDDPDAWPVPYWYVDAAMALMALLLLLEEAGLAATIWGNFRHGARVLDLAGAPDEALVATVLVGRPDGRDVRSASLERDVPPRAARVRRVD